MSKKNIVLWAALLSIMAAITACSGGGGGGGGGGGLPNSDVDATAPTAAVSPVSGSIINGAKQIRVSFSKGMKPSTLAVGGTMASESNSVWSATLKGDDTITVSPQASWTSGSGKTLIIDAADLSGNLLSSLTLTYTVDTVIPTAIVSPVNASTISKSAQITVTFSESMKTGSLVLGGLMASEGDSGVWSKTTNTNDTLTISPTANWTGGSGRTLTIVASDLAENPVAAINATYTVDTTLASGSAAPQNGSALATNQGFKITFTKSMDATSLALNGGLATEIGTPIWSTTTLANDTLTINPATTWSVGEARGISIDASDTLGNPLTTVNLTYDTGVIFVKTSGSNASAGSKASPLMNISYALSITGYPEVHVQAGMYSETITITGRKTLKGSYDTSWTTSNVQSTPTIIDGQSSVGALVVQNSAQAVTVDSVRVTGKIAASSSTSSYAIRVLNSSGPVGFQSLVITAANGANGANGVNGTDASYTNPSGDPGSPAQQYYASCDDTHWGAGGFGYGTGGDGGDGGKMDTNCAGFNYNATAGSNGSDSTDGTFGGYGGGSCNSGIAGTNGVSGSNGSSGAGGSGGTVSSGLWVPSAGGNGTLGTSGKGGGGGGGSGGCDTGTDSYGAGGGGGGAGGAAAPTAGTGGTGGGGSFGILIVNSNVTVNNSSITRGNGGKGGNGGNSGFGQPGAGGGSGGAGAGGAQAGGNGGNGGSGGNSGGGGGGAGGVVYGIYQSGSTVTVTNTTYSGGVPGAGGSGVNSGATGSVNDKN